MTSSAPDWERHLTMPWLRAYPVGVPSTYPYPAVTAPRLLDDAAQDFPGTIAIEYRRHRLTYRTLLDHADRFATALAALGVGSGDRVAVLLPNCPQLVITLFAAWRIGAAVTMPTADNGSSLQHADSRVIVAYAEQVASWRLGSARLILASRSDYLPFPDNVVDPLRRLLRNRPRRTPPRAGAVRFLPAASQGRWERSAAPGLRFAALVRRSLPAADDPDADTGAPALLDPSITHGQLVTNSFQLRLWLPDVVAGDERVLLAIPLASALGVLWIVSAVLSAATMVLIDERRPAARQHAAVAAKPTILPLDVATTAELLRPTRRRSRIPTVRVAIARDPLTAEMRQQLEDLTDKGRVRQAWGIGGVLTHADPVYGRRAHGTVGLPLPDTAAAILSPDQPAAPLGSGKRGRLWLRGPQLQGQQWVDAEVDATLDDNGFLIVHSPAAGGQPPTTL